MSSVGSPDDSNLCGVGPTFAVRRTSEYDGGRLLSAAKYSPEIMGEAIQMLDLNDVAAAKRLK